MKDAKMTSLEDHRRRWREYNRSELGKERYRRWRQSPHGKAKLKEKCQERILFLDKIKSQAGCLICGEANPQALSFVPRDGQKLKFAPQLMHITRSLDDWREVIAACDVLCRNCLAKKRPGRESVIVGERNRVKESGSPQIGAKYAVNGYLQADSTPGGDQHRCEMCGAEFRPLDRPKPRIQKRFCSDRCRLLSWASQQILKAHLPGQEEMKEVGTEGT